MCYSHLCQGCRRRHDPCLKTEPAPVHGHTTRTRPHRDSNTPFVCEALCTSLRYPYFALEKSHWCRCGVMMYNTPRSVREPAYTPESRPEKSGPPDMAMAGKPLPGVRVGDSRFQCSTERCAGDSTIFGCGSASAYDLYKVVDPCVIYRDCGV